MVVEDEPSLLEVISKRMKAAGYRVMEARDGQEAVSLAKHDMPNVLITDVIMPKKNGFDLIQELTRINPDLPAIIITNLEGDQDRDTGTQLKVKHFLIKSNISLRELDQKVAALMK